MTKIKLTKNARNLKEVEDSAKVVWWVGVPAMCDDDLI